MKPGLAEGEGGGTKRKDPSRSLRREIVVGGRPCVAMLESYPCLEDPPTALRERREGMEAGRGQEVPVWYAQAKTGPEEGTFGGFGWSRDGSRLSLARSPPRLPPIPLEGRRSKKGNRSLSGIGRGRVGAIANGEPGVRRDPRGGFGELVKGRTDSPRQRGRGQVRSPSSGSTGGFEVVAGGTKAVAAHGGEVKKVVTLTLALRLHSYYPDSSPSHAAEAAPLRAFSGCRFRSPIPAGSSRAARRPARRFPRVTVTVALGGTITPR